MVLNIIFGVYNRVCFDSQALKVFSSFIYSFLSVPTLSRDILSLKQFKKNIEIALKVFFTFNRTGPIFAKPWHQLRMVKARGFTSKPALLLTHISRQLENYGFASI